MLLEPDGNAGSRATGSKYCTGTGNAAALVSDFGRRTDIEGPTAASPSPRHRPRALVIGAGIGGLTCAVALRRVGIDVEVYERATELRGAGSALSVMSNAVTALAGFGIDLGLDKRGQAVESFRYMDRRGRRIRDLPFKEACDRAGAPSFCISRADLQRLCWRRPGTAPSTWGRPPPASRPPARRSPSASPTAARRAGTS
jgi:hypothetical protein